MRKGLWLLLLLTACKTGPVIVEGGPAHLAMATPFAETSGFQSPVGVGRPFFLLLQREDSGATTAAAELAFQVSGGSYRALQVGAGQYLVWLDEEADYRFAVLRYNVVVGLEPIVRAHPVVRLRLAATAIVETTVEACTARSEVAIADLVRHPNQVTRVTIVGLDASQLPTSGFLPIEFRALPLQLRVESESIFAGGTPNQLVLRPAAELGGKAVIDVAVKESSAALQITIPTDPEEAPCEPAPLPE